MYRESRHLDRKNGRFSVRSAQNRLFFRRKRVLGETKKHPPRIARVVRLVSLRKLSNFFDSLGPLCKEGAARLFYALSVTSKTVSTGSGSRGLGPRLTKTVSG